ncbi:MAG: uncharacterized protein QOJ59_1682 [Thermomicrobiales bacterium]|nr:uncharacterized protein [Thermomicrobiales bacterium]
MIAVVDAGPLYATADADEADHGRVLEVLSRPGYNFIIPTLAIGEVVHFIAARLGPLAEAAFIDGLADFRFEAPHEKDWGRIAELIRQYRDFPLGTVDASVVALAERLNTDLIITLDQRHFRAIRPRHVEAFRLLPE